MLTEEVIEVTIKNSTELFQTYMPFIINGGVFIVTNKNFKMGQILSLKIKIVDEINFTTILSKIIWITPPKTENHKLTGIGVQFMKEDNGATKSKIESILGSNTFINKPTYTM